MYMHMYRLLDFIQMICECGIHKLLFFFYSVRPRARDASDAISMTSSHRPRSAIRNNMRAPASSPRSRDVMRRAQAHISARPTRTGSQVSVVLEDLHAPAADDADDVRAPARAKQPADVTRKKINNMEQERARVDVTPFIARSPYRARQVPEHVCVTSTPYTSPQERSHDVTNRFFDSKLNSNDTYTYYFVPAKGEAPEIGSNLNEARLGENQSEIRQKGGETGRKRRSGSITVEVETPGPSSIDIEVGRGSGLTLDDLQSEESDKERVLKEFLDNVRKGLF